MTAARALNAASEALVVKDLYKSFSGLDVLKGVSLEARQGDVISMIGSSGSGKSTFCAASTCLRSRTGALCPSMVKPSP